MRTDAKIKTSRRDISQVVQDTERPDDAGAESVQPAIRTGGLGDGQTDLATMCTRADPPRLEEHMGEKKNII